MNPDKPGRTTTVRPGFFVHSWSGRPHLGEHRLFVSVGFH